VEDIVVKSDQVTDLERRQNFLEDEITRVVPCCSGDDLMIGDLKQRLLRLRHELDRLHDAAVARRYLH
jgi:hypothetical protein